MIENRIFSKILNVLEKEPHTHIDHGIFMNKYKPKPKADPHRLLSFRIVTLHMMLSALKNK